MVNEMAGEREANPEVFDLLFSFLSDLDRTPPEEERLRMFEIRMLSLFGYRPHLIRCGLCKRDWEELKEIPAAFFSFEKGTLVCGRGGKKGEGVIPLLPGAA